MIEKFNLISTIEQLKEYISESFSAIVIIMIIIAVLLFAYIIIIDNKIEKINKAKVKEEQKKQIKEYIKEEINNASTCNNRDNSCDNIRNRVNLCKTEKEE